MKRITFYTSLGTIAAISLFILIVSDEDCDECFSAPALALRFFAIGVVIFIGSLYFKRKYLETERIIFDLESEPILETDEATAEVPFAGEGIIEETPNVLKSPFTQTPCVYFHAVKEKLVSSGKNSRWEIVENMSLFVPFYVTDERGKLKVDLTNMDDDFSQYKIPARNPGIPDPRNSEIDCEAMLRRSEYNEGSSGFFGSLNRLKYRKTEYILAPGTKVFAYGMVEEGGGELVLRESERCPLIISRKDRDKYVEDFTQGGSLVFLAPALMMIGYTITLYSLNYFLRLEDALLALLFLAGNALIALDIFISLHNRIIHLQQRALNSLSNIDVELKRRADLVPNLVKAVQGYSKHETEVQQIVAGMRAEMMFTRELEKDARPIVPALVAAIENYPELRAAENFQALMKALIDAEERIAYSREFYNRSVRRYNTLIYSFPFLLVSRPLGMREMQFLSIDRSAREITSVA